MRLVLHRIRDPLRAVPVRLKLPLLLALVGLLAYGVGGTLASYTAERALERAILDRLELQAREAPPRAWLNPPAFALRVTRGPSLHAQDPMIGPWELAPLVAAVALFSAQAAWVRREVVS
jgi:hypothetical protein